MKRPSNSLYSYSTMLKRQNTGSSNATVGAYGVKNGAPERVSIGD
jgi:hypothetical protein